MASINKCIFIGNLTKDPEVRYLPNGESVANVSIACNESYKNKAGEKVESVEFINLVFFRRLAEVVGEYLKKGASIYVEGNMKTEKYEKDGVTKYTTKIIVNEMKMLSGKGESQHNEEHPARQDVGPDRKQSKPASTTKTASFDDSEKTASLDDLYDDIPFAPHGKCGAGVSWRCL